jgi:hypothetical protein
MALAQSCPSCGACVSQAVVLRDHKIESITGRALQEMFSIAAGYPSNWDSDSSIDKATWNKVAVEVARHYGFDPPVDQSERLLGEIKQTNFPPVDDWVDGDPKTDFVVLELKNQRCIVKRSNRSGWVAISSNPNYELGSMSEVHDRDLAECLKKACKWLAENVANSMKADKK